MMDDYSPDKIVVIAKRLLLDNYCRDCYHSYLTNNGRICHFERQRETPIEGTCPDFKRNENN